MNKKANVCLSTAVRQALLSASSRGRETSITQSKAIELLLRDYLRKYALGGDKDLRTAATMDAWNRAEQKCFATNQRLNQLNEFSELGQFLTIVRKYVESVIGLAPPKGLLQTGGRWSGGATFSNKRGTHFSEKMETITCTPAVALMLDAFKGLSGELEIVRGNRACAVPKTAIVDRMIAIEPSGNAFLQQAVGSYVRKRLLRVGINLDDQRPNQDGAFRARVDDLSTLDLESASDTVSTSLVEWVIPFEWYQLLKELRSPLTRINGQWRYLEKFSSMGNGYTFELESLIFWAICKACGCDRELLVYGDDLIVPRENAATVVRALNACGFIVNETKSFIDGPYFESCGRHYFDLDEVTPVFQKEGIIDLDSAFRAYNRLTRWALRTGMFWVVRDALEVIRTRYPSECAVPFGAERDDGYLVHPSFIKRDKHGDFLCLVRSYRPRQDGRVIERNAYAYKLYHSGHSNETCEGYVARDTGASSFIGLRTVKVWASSLIAR